MGNKAYNNRIEKILSLENEVKELQAIIESIKDELKADMAKNDLQEVQTGAYIVRYKDITSCRIDSAKIKKELPDIYNMYSKTTTCKRFSIN